MLAIINFQGLIEETYYILKSYRPLNLQNYDSKQVIILKFY